jgi:uncharacterized membrane protein
MIMEHQFKFIHAVLFITLAIGLLITNANQNATQSNTTHTQTDITTNSNSASSSEINQQTTQQDALDAKAETLSGTCPRNRRCLSPSCGLWSDINKDGVCDRSYY